jgi:rod shape determining protein RodA
MLSRISVKNIDWVFILATAGILCLGSTYLCSASEQYFAKQVQWIGIGVIAMCSVIVIGYDRLLRLAYPIYAAALALLIVVLFMRPHRGAHSWIDLPGFSIQPSEFAKIAIVLALSKYMMFKENQWTLTGIIPPMIMAMIPVALILKQPDLGTAMTIIPMLFLVMFVSGARKLHLFSALMMGAASAVPMWMFILKTYQKNRILAFLNPVKYEAREAYQLIMSTIAIGSGGFWGSGWGKGTCNTLGLVPDRHTDFIFVVISEEGGMKFAILMVILFTTMVISGLLSALATREPGGRIAAAAATSIIGSQALINMGVVTAILPTTGITLPLVSYGGSSMIATFVLIGIIISVRMHRPTVLHKETFQGKTAIY